MKTSTARANNWKCPECADETTRDDSGHGFVRHRTNRNCSFERGQRDGIVQRLTDGRDLEQSRPRMPATVRQGQKTAEFGRWLTAYLRSSTHYKDYKVYYDHGDKQVEANVLTTKGFFGDVVSNLNRLADVDVMIVAPGDMVKLLIEIEERAGSPKKILGNVLANLICNRFAIKQSGSQRYFSVDSETKLVIAGIVPTTGNRLSKIKTTILPRLKLFPGLSDGIRPTNIDLVFNANIDETIQALQNMINALFPEQVIGLTHLVAPHLPNGSIQPTQSSCA